jgi:hypothetical protein
MLEYGPETRGAKMFYLMIAAFMLALLFAVFVAALKGSMEVGASTPSAPSLFCSALEPTAVAA